MIEIRLQVDGNVAESFISQFYKSVAVSPEDALTVRGGFAPNMPKPAGPYSAAAMVITDTNEMMANIHRLHAEQYDFLAEHHIDFDYVWCGRFFFHNDKDAVFFKLRFAEVIRPK